MTADLRVLKADHIKRPLWVSKDLSIYFESFSQSSKQAQDLLISIAEPITRPRNIHEYRLSEYSLYAASSVGLETNHIINALETLSKTALPEAVVEFIRAATKQYAKVKLVLQNNSFFIESKDQKALHELLNDSVIKESRLGIDTKQGVEMITEYILPHKLPHVPNPVVRPAEIDSDPRLLQFFDDHDEFWAAADNNIDTIFETETRDINIDTENTTIPLETDLPDNNLGALSDGTVLHSFEIKKDCVEKVKQKCSELQYPLLEEYDYNADNRDLVEIDLKPAAKLRPYQIQCLGKMFGNNRARSGIIVLPCGAGKTLVGVSAACTIKKSVLVLCNSNLSVEQWAREFRYWSTIKDSDLGKFSSETKCKFDKSSGILVTTYTMLSFSGKRAYDAQKMMDFIMSREWGLLLMDEVHVVPAEMFKKTLTIVAAHAKLGLTATLVREDDKINTLNWLIGPKLYEANWLELADLGYIANVQCSEVWCPMALPFFREYLRAKSRKRQLLYVMNPKKIQACQYLINLHEAMGDKIIVFSDNIFALKHYSAKLSRPFIYGGTGQGERIRLLQQFRFNPALNTIFLSKVGDTSIDLPEATCLIQISSQYGSRRQEAQRLGRILRPKKGVTANNGFSAYFYSLVSTDTEEMKYASKRQQFLLDQGYEFKVITNIGDGNSTDTVYETIQDQLALLNTVMLSSETDLLEDEDEELNEGILVEQDERESLTFVRRETNTLSSLSGADSMAYLEFSRRR